MLYKTGVLACHMPLMASVNSSETRRMGRRKKRKRATDGKEKEKGHGQERRQG